MKMVRNIVVIVLVLLYFFNNVNSARILAVYPTPSISHQVPFRRVTNELLRKGHEVVVITTDPEFKNRTPPAKLTEIDVHDRSYEIWRNSFLETATGKMDDLKRQVEVVFQAMLDIVVEQVKMPEVQRLLYNETFDLLLVEAWIRPPLIFSHFHKVPMIIISSFTGHLFNHESMGSASHPILYPYCMRQKLYDLSMWDKAKHLYKFYSIYNHLWNFEKVENEALRQISPDMPDLRELYNNIDMMMFNTYPVWDSNRPVPPNVIYIGGIHQVEHKELPRNLETYLNSSRNGVIYVSFGTNTSPSTLPRERIQTMINAFSKVPYDVLWKWDTDNLAGISKNIRISKWFPQSDLLRHPKIKLFITQAGLQSTDEAILAGVPLIAIPMLGDQWFNAEKIVHLKIGRQLSMETSMENDFVETMTEVISNPSYQHNIAKLRALVHDQPQIPLDRAVWWIEYALRHGGTKHLRAAGANMPWQEYIELDLLLVILSVVVGLVVTVVVLGIFVKKNVAEYLLKQKKIKDN